MDLGLTGWAIALIAACSVGLAKGGLGMVAMMSVPLMSLIMSPVQAAGILLPVYIVSDIGGIIVYRRDYNRDVLLRLLPGAVAGVVLGWATATLVPEERVSIVVGLIGFGFALNALLRPRLGPVVRRPRWGAGSFWGTVAGYTSFVSHSGMPPYQVYVQPLGLSPLSFAGTTTLFFAIVNVVKLIPYAALGQFSAGNLQIAAVLSVPALIAVWVGMRLVRVMPEKIFYAFITWGLLLVSLRLIWMGL